MKISIASILGSKNSYHIYIFRQFAVPDETASRLSGEGIINKSPAMKGTKSLYLTILY